MLSEEALRRALAVAGLSARVRWDETTASTNATALELVAEGAPPWSLVAAGHQTAGRGRAGRVWHDRPGAALLFSVVLRPAWEPERVGLVSLAAGAAMSEAASEVSDVEVGCKWPNDLLAEGAKVGGVLGETEITDGRIAHVVVGVGVNLEAPEAMPDAGAIGPVPEEELLSGFLRRFRSLVDGVPGAIVDRWRGVSATLGRQVVATTIGGETVRGVAVDLDDTGALVVETDAGRVRVAFGEIEHLGVDQG